jgi:hypothetical protein
MYYWRIKRKGQWVEVPVSELEDNHLLNILKKAKRDATKKMASARSRHLSWHYYTTMPADTLRALAQEATKRGIVWDKEEVKVRGELKTSNTCVSCRLGAICLVGDKVVSRQCERCKRCYVVRGGGVRTIFVNDDCPNRVEARGTEDGRLCYECQKATELG